MKTQSSMGRTSSSPSKCCGSKCSQKCWLLYILVIIALILSGINFWMNLYRHEALKAEFKELKRKQNETNEKIHNPQFHELYLAAKVSQHLIDKDDKKNRTGASVKARVIYEEDYNAQIDNLTEGIAKALKHEVSKNATRHLDRMNKQIDALKKKVDRYYDQTELIRNSYTKHGQTQRQLQQNLLAFHKTKGDIFKSMKRLNDTIYNTTMIKQKLDHDSIKNLEEEVQELNKVLTLAHDELQVHGNNVTDLVFDTNAIGEWQTLTDNKITGLRNELENTADSIMDKMFEKDDSIGKKMKEYDTKILSLQNDYNKLQADITMTDRDAKNAKLNTEDKINQVSGEITKINQTLHSEMDRLITEKSRSMSVSGYNDYDFGERGRLSSLLKVYAKKDTVDHLSASVEQLKSSIQFISEQKNQLELVGNRNTYYNERLNETLQDMKQKLDYLERDYGGNANELLILKDWKNQMIGKVETMTYNVTRVESKINEINSKQLPTLEHKNKRYGAKLARLSKNLIRLQKLPAEIESIKSQITTLEQEK